MFRNALSRYTSSALRAPSPQRGRLSQRGEFVPRGQLTNGFCPNTETFSAVHNISVVWLSRLARSLGGLGGREPVAAQSPECAFLRRFRVSGFCLRSFAQAKNGVNLRRRSHKNSVDKAKTNRSHHQITVTPAPRSDSLPFPYTAAWLSELCVVSDPPAG